MFLEVRRGFYAAPFSLCGFPAAAADVQFRRAPP